MLNIKYYWLNTFNTKLNTNIKIKMTKLIQNQVRQKDT